ncbi:hypothetical protein D0817_25400, partial [Flavobacterium cupreum]
PRRDHGADAQDHAHLRTGRDRRGGRAAADRLAGMRTTGGPAGGPCGPPPHTTSYTEAEAQ